MSRSTQFIGLSKEAYAFLHNNQHKELAVYEMTTGLFTEPVYGRIYEVTIDSNFGYEVRTYAEVEDVTPWSSGPMIHTALRNLQTGEVEFRWKEEDVHYI